MNNMITSLFRQISVYLITIQTAALIIVTTSWIIISHIRDYTSAIQQPSVFASYLAFLFGLLTALIAIVMVVEIVQTAAYRRLEVLGASGAVLIGVHVICEYAYHRAVYVYHFGHPSDSATSIDVPSDKRHGR